MARDELVEQLLSAQTRMLSELAELRATMACVRPAHEFAPPVPLSSLLKAWADAHGKLSSFACDYARAELVLSFAPTEGKFAGIAFGQRDANTLEATDVDLYRAWRYSTTTRLRRPPSPATVNRELMMLKRILNFGVSRKTLARNPLEGLDDEDEDNAREVVIEEDGFQAIVAGYGANDVARAFTTLAYDSGMRRTEVLLCRASWLDPERGYVHIPGAVAKNGEPRITDLSPRAWELCSALPRHFRTDLLFPNAKGTGPANVRELYRKFHESVVASGVRGRDGTVPVFHDLRRSWITLARRRGIAETVIMAKSGHKDHAVFKRYSIVGDEDLRASWVTMESGRQQDLAKLASRRGPQSVAQRASTD